MFKLLFASLIAAGCTSIVDAAPDTTTPRQTAPMACLGGTDVMVQIDQRSELPDGTTSTFVLSSNGTWVYKTFKAGKPDKVHSSCISQTDAKALKKALDDATWSTTHAEVTCTAYAHEWHEYRLGKKLVLTRRLCDSVILDKKSEDALAKLNTIVSP
jgi:hypothetical protein